MSEETPRPEQSHASEVAPNAQESTKATTPNPQKFTYATRSKALKTEEQPSVPESAADASVGASSDSESVDGFVDYSHIYEGLQERFNQAYSVSQKLFVTEKIQRQTLYHYKRRVNALLDVLQDMEDCQNDNIEEPLDLDHGRLSSLVTWCPELGSSLQPALDISMGNKKPSEIPLKRTYSLNLAVEEMVPELENDELDIIETNPQDTEMWVRRNFLQLAVSKFRPAEIRARGVREYVEPQSLSSKRKKRI